MGDALTGLQAVSGIGSTGVLVIVVLLIFTGKLPTLRELRDSQERERRAQEREARAMELADKWQAVAMENGMTLHQILDGLEVANHAMTEIQAALREHGENMQ